MNSMLPTTFTSWFVYIVLALLLGALGTGLWESILKPLLMKTASLSLKVLTFGMKSAQKRIFVQIAKRAPYRASLFLIGLLPLTFCGLVGFNAAVYSGAGERHAQAMFAPIEELAKVNPQLAAEKAFQLKKEASEKLHLFGLLVSCAGFVFTAYYYIKYVYILSAINFFEQCMNICGPYFKDAEEKQIISDFALITNASDFSNVIHRLRTIAEANNMQLPPFATL